MNALFEIKQLKYKLPVVTKIAAVFHMTQSNKNLQKPFRDSSTSFKKQYLTKLAVVE